MSSIKELSKIMDESYQLIRLLIVAVVMLCLGACTNYDVDQPDTPANQKGFERPLAPKGLLPGV